MPRGFCPNCILIISRNNVASRLVIGVKYYMMAHFIRSDYWSNRS